MTTASPSHVRFRGALLAAGAALILGGSAVGAAAYSALKPAPEASAPISAVPLTAMSANDATGTSNDEAPSAAVYEIQPAQSQASFTIDEVLRGAPKTVVGTTNQVSGQIALDLNDVSAAQVGTILIDARTLVTDDSSRNRVLGNAILGTGQYEYIAFVPTHLNGLPATASAGQPFTFQIEGDLTIRDTTRPATFDVTVTPSANGSLSGTATTMIRYADWGINIPNVPFVAGVGDQVALAFTFQADA